ncbi:MAG: hypothetical protein KAR39_00495 [Thermoplasmata archaeon]|nr:hypothetical protein [Thermoplasmata archaeon]
MSPELSVVEDQEATSIMNANSLIPKRYVRVPQKTRKRLPIVPLGVGAFSTGVGFLWVTGSLLFSGALAVIGTGLIVGGMHSEEKAQSGR